MEEYVLDNFKLIKQSYIEFIIKFGSLWSPCPSFKFKEVNAKIWQIPLYLQKQKRSLPSKGKKKKKENHLFLFSQGQGGQFCLLVEDFYFYLF